MNSQVRCNDAVAREARCIIKENPRQGAYAIQGAPVLGTQQHRCKAMHSPRFLKQQQRASAAFRTIVDRDIRVDIVPCPSRSAQPSRRTGSCINSLLAVVRWGAAGRGFPGSRRPDTNREAVGLNCRCVYRFHCYVCGISDFLAVITLAVSLPLAAPRSRGVGGAPAHDL